MANLCKSSIPLFFVLAISLVFFSSMVESGGRPGVNVLTKFCKALATDSHGDYMKKMFAENCSYFLERFKTGDWSSFTAIKMIETSHSISLITNLTQAATGAEATVKECLSLHTSSLSKIKEAFQLYKTIDTYKTGLRNLEVPEGFKAKVESLVIEVTKQEEACQAAVSGLSNAPAKLVEASKFEQKVIAGTKYIIKANCQFGYAPQGSKFC